MPSTAPKGLLNLEDLKSLLWTAILAAAAAASSVMIDYLSNPEGVDWKHAGIAAGTAALLMFLKTIQKLLQGPVAPVLLALLLTAAGNAAWAADITAPTQAPVGTLIRATTTAKADGYIWWVIGPDGFADSEKIGNRVVFTGKPNVDGTPGRYMVLLVCTNKDGTADQGQAVVLIGGSTPPPPGPGPDPVPPTPPGPGPVVPADEFGNVGQLMAKQAWALPPTARAQAVATAALYRTAARKLEDASFPTVASASTWVQAERVKAWGSNANDWNTAIAPVVARWNENWPMTKDRVIKFYDCVAVGLESVK